VSYSRLLLPLLLFAAISCASEAETREEKPAPQTSPLALFATQSGITTVDLDTGAVKAEKDAKPAIPYVFTSAGDGGYLVSYIDWNLECGFGVYDGKGKEKERLHGYAAERLSDNAFIGVMVSDVLEDSAAGSKVALIKVSPEFEMQKMARTIALAPQALRLDGGALGTPLLMTYEPRNGPDSLFYCWQCGVEFTAINSAAEKLWSSKVSTGSLATDMVYVGDCGGVLLLYAQFDYLQGEFIGLDANTGKPLWQRKSTIIPVFGNDYPYADFAYQLPLELGEGYAAFPAYDSGESVKGKCIVGLLDGDLRLEHDETWNKRADDAWLAEQVPAEANEPKSWDLGGGDKLSIGSGVIKLASGGKEVWECKLAQHFGTGLELEKAGKKFLLLIEKPSRQSGASAQGIAYVIDRATGEEPLSELELGAQYFVPVIIGGKALVLEPNGTRLSAFN
jgi:hypothetical protein